MPGSSLWLIPQPSKFNTAAQELISSTIPQLFPSVKAHQFIPHLTLTSSIEVSSTYGDQPQKWLDSLTLSDEPVNEDVQICLDAIEPGEPFFKKLTLSAKHDDRLVQLAAACRCYGVENGDMDRARDWAKAEYMPHLSLM
ncbi:hypothetical protein PMZ80_004596 [Knufia obscura]|uniref:2',3'-cyclic-nucleotide 3'-phosphodiesterase n=1 Tax=Knufia obscura TaxID=1635080 RepID=A0ABR0RSP3_9EURO|nr:hypothetical protein PMZ80_004596 [Knufia obscura]